MYEFALQTRNKLYNMQQQSVFSITLPCQLNHVAQILEQVIKNCNAEPLFFKRKTLHLSLFSAPPRISNAILQLPSESIFWPSRLQCNDDNMISRICLLKLLIKTASFPPHFSESRRQHNCELHKIDVATTAASFYCKLMCPDRYT